MRIGRPLAGMDGAVRVGGKDASRQAVAYPAPGQMLPGRRPRRWGYSYPGARFGRLTLGKAGFYTKWLCAAAGGFFLGESYKS